MVSNAAAAYVDADASDCQSDADGGSEANDSEFVKPQKEEKIFELIHDAIEHNKRKVSSVLYNILEMTTLSWVLQQLGELAS